MQLLSSELPLAGVSVLLAEDNIDSQYLIGRILKKNGAIVEIANDGDEAIRLGLSHHFDVILMDVKMPVTDGYTATKALRQLGCRKPILALTAHVMEQVQSAMQEAGCNGYIIKPTRQTELVRIIERALQRH